jgi:hypothetical protein
MFDLSVKSDVFPARPAHIASDIEIEFLSDTAVIPGRHFHEEAAQGRTFLEHWIDAFVNPVPENLAPL